MNSNKPLFTPPDIEKIKHIIKQLFNTSLVISLVGLVFILLLFWSMCFKYIAPYEFGVKQVNIGLHRGLQPKIYETGLHFIMPLGLQEMHIFPKNIQVFDLTNRPKHKINRTEKAAHIQTSDGFFVEVDVSIIYRITDPLKVIQEIGPGKLYEDNGIIPKAEPVLKDTLGQLTTEAFYNSVLRVEKMKLAQQKLNEELKEKGIQVEHVLIRYFKYSTEIQKNIEDKKLKDQLVFKNKAEARAAAEKALLQKVIEEGEATLAVELEKGNAYVVKRNAEMNLYSRQKHAAGDLLIKLAEAEKTRLKNNALTVEGSENLVGLRMAEVLDGIELIVLPSDSKKGLNPLNLNQVMGLFE